MIEKTNSLPDFTSTFNDSRIDSRATSLLKNLVNTRKSSISKLSDAPSEQKAFYRLLENTKFSEDLIKEKSFSKTNVNCKNRHVLAVNDTVDFNLEGQKGRVDLDNGFGLSSNTTMGFKLHSSLVLDAKSLFPLGFSSIDIWNRPFEVKEGNYSLAKIEDKESFKWIKAINDSTINLESAASITFIADREADIYDVLAKPRAEKIHFVLRSKSNRKINNATTNLHTYLSEIKPKFSYTSKIEGDARKKSTSREALLEVKYESILLEKPDSCNDKTLKQTTPINVIEVSEKTNSKTKIHWLLYTTHKVTNEYEATQIIEWYRARWNIEQIHRLLKTEGLEIEKTQLEKASSIKKMIILSLSATLRVMQLNIAYNKEVNQDINIVFDNEEQLFLDVLKDTLEGKTEKLKNPFNKNDLRWSTWIIARLGSWKGFKSQRPPGVITIQKGLVKFYNMYDGYCLAQKILVGKR